MKSLRRELDFVVADDIAPFFALLSESYRDHGTPIFGLRYFTLLREVFGRAMELSVVSDRECPLTDLMAFYFRDEVHPIYTGGSRRARQVQANDYLYLRMMARARARGVRIFDFGRSKFGTGAFENKQHWGFKPQALHYAYKLITCKEPPSLNPLDPKFRLFVRAWKRLPLGLSRLIGPILGPHLG